MYDANTHYLLMARLGRRRRSPEVSRAGSDDDRVSAPIAPEMEKKSEAKMVTRTDRMLRAYGGTGPRHSVVGRDTEPRSYEPEVV